ncbi:MAG: energy transducer TonB [Bacteroidetes bacterium]|nr:energy transducer TonB [Bacteroidota bacterium]
MKHPEDKPHKNKKFLKVPTFPGGTTEFVKFIAENLKYPEEAIKNQTEGTVYLEYTVDDLGNIGDELVVHGIGHGCDEEALRLVRLMKYPAVKNRGVRLKSKMKTRIHFELPLHLKPSVPLNISYVTTTQPKTEKPETPSRPSYGYTINLD